MIPGWLKYIPFVILAEWPFICLIAAATGGWKALAKQYRFTGRFEGKRFRFVTGKMGLSNYGGAMTLGVNSEGLMMAVNPALRIGHPPLFIRWEDMEAKIERYYMIERVVIRFKKLSGVQFAISKRAAFKMKDEPGARLLAGLF